MPHSPLIGFLATALVCTTAIAGCSGSDGSQSALEETCVGDACDVESLESGADAAKDAVVAEDSSPFDSARADTARADTYVPPPPGCTTYVDGDEDQFNARRLADITDCDGTGSSFSGTLADGSDVDWARYKGSDNFGCSVDPWAKTTQPVELCVHANCPILGVKSVSCTKGTKRTVDGSDACCTGSSGGEVQLSLDCVDYRDDAFIFMRVRDVSGTCKDPSTSYTVQYHF